MKKITALLSLILLLSCSDNKKELMSDLSVDFPETLPINKVAEYKNLDLYNPTSFVVKDSLLFVIDRDNECLGRCFNINTSEEISKFLFKGNSNIEMIYAEYLSLYGNDSINVICGNYPSMVKTYPIDIIYSKENVSTSTIKRPDSINCFHYDKIAENTLFGVGRIHKSQTGKYFLLTPNGLETFGEHDKDLFISNIEMENDDMNWDSFIAVSPSKDKVALGSKIGFFIEVVNLKTKSLDYGKYYSKIEMEIERTNSSVSKSMWSSHSTSAIGCTDKNIIVADIETIYEKDNERPTSYNSILIFDWELNPVKKFNVEKAGYLKFISQDGKYFYTLLSHDGEENYSLIKYSIE